MSARDHAIEEKSSKIMVAVITEKLKINDQAWPRGPAMFNDQETRRTHDQCSARLQAQRQTKDHRSKKIKAC